jgi:hypothetical protein
MKATDVFNDGEVNELLRWKDLSFNVLEQNLVLPTVFRKSVVLAGGVYTSWHHMEKIKDIDVFILNDGHDAAILNYLKSQVGKIFTSFNNAPEYKRDNPHINDVYNAETVIHAAKYQFIFTKYKTREELISHFDYLHCTPNYHNGNLFVRKDAYDAIRDKKLIVHNEKNQVEWRRNKFISRGFTQMIKLARTRGQIDWSKINTA